MSAAERTVLVTGAARGIGRGIAMRFARDGGHAALVDQDDVGLEDVRRAIVDNGGAASTFTGDVGIDADVRQIVDRVVEQRGAIDVLINNAGLLAPQQHVLESSEQWWDQFLQTNLKSQYLFARYGAVSMVRQRRGVIINMSSAGASRSHRGMAAYDASKGGIEALTRSLALDLAPYGIRVNAIAPGIIATASASAEERAALGASVPLERPGSAQDVAGVAAFLASDDAAYVTAVIVTVDGGLTAQLRFPQVESFPPARFPRPEEVAAPESNP